MRSSTFYFYIVFFASILLLAGVGYYWYSTFQNWSKANQDLEHNYAVLQSTETVLSLLKDVEIGQRGLMLTGDSAFFIPFTLAVAALPTELHHLDSLLAEPQRQTMNKLHVLVQKRIYYARKTLAAAFAPPDENPHLKLVYMRRGKVTMDTTRMLIKTLKDRELTQIPQLNLYKVRAALRSTIGLLVAFGLSITLFAGTFFRMIKELFRRLKTEKLLLRNLTELQRSHAQMDDINYVSVHHLQEPLRKLNVFSDHIQQKHGEELSPDLRFLVGKLSSAAGEISHLIKDLTAYTTLGKTPDQQNFAAILITQVLQKMVADFSVEIDQQSAKIEWEEDLPTIDGNSEQLRLLFSHLLSNSLKFAKPEVPLLVRINSNVVSGVQIPGVAETDHDYTFYQINFSDNGIGIDKKYAHVIFELFQRLTKDKDVPGTGIGLAICKNIMLNHNGYITLKSELNHGSTFSLYFPL